MSKSSTPRKCGKIDNMIATLIVWRYNWPVSTLGEIESAVERLPLAQQEELFSRLAAKLSGQPVNGFPVREDHLKLLDERFAAYRDDPKQASTWEDVKRRFEARRS
jgi:putative addiction module component (TIGR02574 family)